ncbi:hypothetical protein T492DRAFT_402023 [Pavlovales sp. CCMP2436]|nr:hypothetical protein T492DRAFT_402023 [Pavlovales sp. CCMP2436]
MQRACTPSCPGLALGLRGLSFDSRCPTLRHRRPAAAETSAKSTGRWRRPARRVAGEHGHARRGNVYPSRNYLWLVIACATTFYARHKRSKIHSSRDLHFKRRNFIRNSRCQRGRHRGKRRPQCRPHVRVDTHAQPPRNSLGGLRDIRVDPAAELTPSVYYDIRCVCIYIILRM